MTREATNRLLEMIEDGLLDRDTVIGACVKYMSEDDVRDMCHANEFFVDDDDDDDETRTSGAWDVFLNNKLIDTVWHDNATVDEVHRSLINHDGYDSKIVVRKGK